MSKTVYSNRQRHGHLCFVTTRDMLLHYLEPDSYALIYQTTSKRSDIHNLIDKTVLISETILLQHAFLGCGTVSRIFGIGKGRIMDNPHLLSVCANVPSIFKSVEASKNCIQKQERACYLQYIKINRVV